MTADTDLFDYIDVVEKVFASALMVTVFPFLNWVLRLSILKAALPSEKDPLGLGKILGYAPFLMFFCTNRVLTFFQ